jgi:hypothetical protein
MSTVRKLAREAVIFMLLGPVVAAFVPFVLLEKRSIPSIKSEAAQSVFAIDAAQEPPGFTPVNSVLVPLTNGMHLYVTDCAQAHPRLVPKIGQYSPSDIDTAPAQPGPAAKPLFDMTKAQPIQAVPPVQTIAPGTTNGSDCVYFDAEPWVRYGGHRDPVRLGSPVQIAIEKEYWQAYAKASQHRTENMMAAAVLSLWGFPGGLLLWVFYRLVRFAVKG